MTQCKVRRISRHLRETNQARKASRILWFEVQIENTKSMIGSMIRTAIHETVKVSLTDVFSIFILER